MWIFKADAIAIAHVFLTGDGLDCFSYFGLYRKTNEKKSMLDKLRQKSRPCCETQQS